MIYNQPTFTYTLVDRSGNRTIIFKDKEQYQLHTNAKYIPTKHLLIYKYLKRIIIKLINFLDSNYFKYSKQPK